MVGAYVESLFSSLDNLETANTCYKPILDMEVELDNFNHKKSLECVDMHYTKQEVLVNPPRESYPPGPLTSVPGRESQGLMRRSWTWRPGIWTTSGSSWLA